MSNMNFTPAQQNAIDARGGSILVSAAAGSGKTRVLVQRVIKLLTDSENPIDADRLLIVTFTNAAAAEMKSRISSAVDELLIQQPNNESLRRQQLLLPRADICTIHSFCNRIIKENFYLLDVNRDYRIGSESEFTVLQRNVLKDIIEEMYSSGREDFVILREIFAGAKSDSDIEKTILDVYNKSNSHPFPQSWIDGAVEFYNPDIPLSETVFAMKVFDYMDSILGFVKSVLGRGYEVIDNNEAFQKDNKTSAINCYDYYNKFVNKLIDLNKKNSWDAISNFISCYNTQSYRKPTGKNIDVTEEECTKVKNCFDLINSSIMQGIKPFFDFTDEIYSSDTKQLYPVVKCLSEILNEFRKRYSRFKKERGILEFSDLEHLLLKLLVKKTENGYQKTDFAEDLSQQYDEIMIDEYQDTNEAQEMIFRAISKNEKNIFVVGDVKQSIYRFREAMPEIFIRRREKCSLYDDKNPKFPSKIILDKNFRSREGIIESVNFVFERLMSQNVGGVEYNADEKLVVGANYPQTSEPEVELHIIENKSIDESEMELSSDEAEAGHIVSIINDMISKGFEIKDGEKMRPVRYGDFCVLLRNLSTHARVFSDVLNKNGIPAYTEKQYSLFECYEVNVALSFLKIVDNPVQDIPLLSVMFCPVFGFTPDDLSVIKSDFKRKSLYGSVVAAANNCDPNKGEDLLKNKCLEFIKSLSYYRNISITVTTDTLLNIFFEKTGYVSVISAMKNGNIRIKNLRKLMNFVREYESGSDNGLTGFVRFIAYLEESGSTINAGDTSPADSVKIMSIHHSKGLEFPICIMAATASRGDARKDTVLCHSQLGFGINTIDRKNMLKFSTLQRSVINKELERESKSEELRVLYVAMTRAKEKLIMLSTVKSGSENSYQKMLGKAAASMITDGNRISEYSVENAKTLSDWIIMCALLHPSMDKLREDAGVEGIIAVPTKSVWKYEHIVYTGKDEIETPEEEYTPNISVEMMDFLKKRFAEKYPFEDRTKIPSKISASALAHNKNKFEFVAKSRPSFAYSKKMTGTERGTALHIFMHYADLEKMKYALNDEKKRIIKSGFMSEEQCSALDDNDILKFTDGELYRRMLNADKVYREYRFTINISAKDVDENTDCCENVILQGAVDCLFIEDNKIVIIDYKTDRVKEIQQLSELYSKQLELYKKAIEAVFELPVKECIIYSLHLGEQIKCIINNE